MKYALRQLLKSPGFAFTAILTLALGIGLNTSMFSVLTAVLLKPISLPNENRLVRVYRTTPQSQTAAHTTPGYVALARESNAFLDVTGYRPWSYSMAEGSQPPVNLNALRVSASFFRVLGLNPAAGRFFRSDEDLPGSNVIVLSHNVWQSHFGGDPAVVGRTVRIDGQPATIIGVAPAIPNSYLLWRLADSFHPLALTEAERNDQQDAQLQVIGRMRDELSLDQLNAQLAVVAEQLARHRPAGQADDGLRGLALEASVQNPTLTGFTWMLLALAAFVLLIACANLANLQLARALGRAHEFAVRAALGASRGRLLQPLLYESLVLSLAGGLLGILVAVWTNDWLATRISIPGVVTWTLALDWGVLVFTFAISVATGLAFGLAPAWLTSRVRLNDTLKSGGRGHTGDRAQNRLRHALIVAQFALALVLLVGAGVFIRGLDGLLTRDLGWNQRSMMQGVINLPQSKYSAEKAYLFYTQLQERLRGLPSVENVTIGWTLPIFGFLTSRSYVVDDREPPPAGREPVAFVNAVMPSYLPTLGVELIAGRNFTEADTADAPHVAIINESMARTLFPGENPIGRRLGGLDPGQRDWMEIVGVMPDLGIAVRANAPATPFQVFRPLAQETWHYVNVALRSDRAETLAEPMRRIVTELDPDLPMQRVGTIEQQLEMGTLLFRLSNLALVCFASLGLFLAALGLYAVIARLVLLRRTEIGIRLALGAQPSNIAWLMLGSGLRLSLLGIGVGLLASLGLIEFIARLLPEYPVRDPLAIGAVTGLLLVIALLACWLPARRATKVDPLTALRAE